MPLKTTHFTTDYILYCVLTKIRVMSLVPPTAVLLTKELLRKRYDLSCVESLICGAAPLGKEVVLELYKLMPSLRAVKQGKLIS